MYLIMHDSKIICTYVCGQVCGLWTDFCGLRTDFCRHTADTADKIADTRGHTAELQIPDSVPVPKTTESTSRIPFSFVPTVIPKKSDRSAVSHLATPTADRPRNVPVNSVDIRNQSQFRPEYLRI
jgi:hypothetical protein